MVDPWTEALDLEANALCESATAGPWHNSSDVLWAVVSQKPNGNGRPIATVAIRDEQADRADAAFIARSRTLFPAALEEIRLLRGDNAGYERELAVHQERNDILAVERDTARQEVERLRETLDDAPHGGSCLCPTLRSLCNCWKAAALKEPTP